MPGALGPPCAEYQDACRVFARWRARAYELPAGWSTCAAINPEDDDYHVTPLDQALRSRFLNLHVRAERKTWLEWAQGNQIHRAVMHLARNDSHFLDDVPPRTWTNLSRVLKSMKAAQLRDQRLLQALIGGFLPKTWAQNLLVVINNSGAATGVDVYRILSHCHTDQMLQKELGELASNGRTPT